MSKTIPLHEIASLYAQLQEHADNDRELLSKVKEPTLKARLEGKVMTYEYTIKKIELMLGRCQ